MSFDISFRNQYFSILQNNGYFPVRSTSSDSASLEYIHANSFEDSTLLEVAGLCDSYGVHIESDIILALKTCYDLLDFPSEPLDFHNLPPKEIIAFSQKNHVTGNCITHAELLRGILCAMGYETRILRCLPLDFHFQDCHVITEVYSQEQQKWLFLDPANQTYMRKNSSILSTLELRNALIDNSITPLNVEVVTQKCESRFLQLFKERYITYLLKNSVRYETFDCQNETSPLYRLNPANYYNPPTQQPVYEKVNIGGEFQIKRINYCQSTDDFWPRI